MVLHDKEDVILKETANKKQIQDKLLSALSMATVLQQKRLSSNTRGKPLIICNGAADSLSVAYWEYVVVLFVSMLFIP